MSYSNYGNYGNYSSSSYTRPDSSPESSPPRWNGTPGYTTSSQLEPRSRRRNGASSGESDSEDPNVGYRALRPDERDPWKHGVKFRPGSDPSVTMFEHVRSGSRSSRHAQTISFTRSSKTASAWAAEEGGSERFVQVDLEGVRRHDLTDPEHMAASGLRGPAQNFAKGSQEVLSHEEIGRDRVLGVYGSQRWDGNGASRDADNYIGSVSTRRKAGEEVHTYDRYYYPPR